VTDALDRDPSGPFDPFDPDDLSDDGGHDHEPPSEEELNGLVFDPDNSPIEGWELMSTAERQELLGDDLYPDDPDEDRAPELFEAGFTHRYAGHGTGFTAGGPLDVMPPGPELAWHVGQARQAGLGTLSDDELCGVIQASGRLSSWQAELQLAAAAELDARRAAYATACGDRRAGEHVGAELAALLTLTGWSADALLELSRRLQRLPQTTALLAAGVIDRARAAVIADELGMLPDADAAAAEDRIAPRAGEMTTGQLRAECRRAILAYDPQAATRRREKAEKDARVDCWAEPSGTGAIAGRDLNLAQVIAADRDLDADARWLQQRGAPGTVDQLRAQVLLARLTGQPLESLLPRPTTDPASPAAPVSDPAAPAAPGIDLSPPAAPGSDPSPPAAFSRDPAPPTYPGGWPAPLAGSVNLVMPATAWLGLSDSLGEITGTRAAGAADAGTCRDLAAALAARSANPPAPRWCLTLTDPRGRAIAHGCARAGPGPPGTTDPAAWLAQIPITTLESGTCSHRRESAGYRPAPTLRHLIKIRSPRCGYPGCRRSARRCDDDHTIPFHKGGKTCECNLYPLCRQHHGTKQGPGWRLEQREPGILTWTLPSGRRYTVAPEPYPG
jgi:Domain of unknown function (DUF222)